jgi:DNA primase
VRIRPGEDCGLDTVATAGQALMELIRAAGGRMTAMLDGAGGLYLAGRGDGRPDGRGAGSLRAARFAGELADRSPEIATTSGTDTAGRAYLEPLRAGGDGMPSPYSLVHGPNGLAVIAPLSWDEVAAVTAGMPLEIGPAEVDERLCGGGDLARELTGVIED